MFEGVHHAVMPTAVVLGGELAFSLSTQWPTLTHSYGGPEAQVLYFGMRVFMQAPIRWPVDWRTPVNQWNP